MRNMSRPTVSVILPTFDREKLLPRAVESVIAQSFDDWEIILIDDGSTDGTPDIARRYAERLRDRFTIIRQPNGGSSMARNRGIDACRGRFVAFLDSDDEFLPTKLERQLALFSLRPELGFVYCDMAYIDLEGNRHESVFDFKRELTSRVSYETVAPGLCRCSGDLFDVLLRGYFIPTIVGMVRREVLGSSIRFPRDQAYAEEWLFYLKVAKACHTGFVGEPLCLHHYTAGSLARTDKERNAFRYCCLLRAIAKAFDDLTDVQRQVIRHQLGDACGQLGYNALRNGRYGQSALRFAEASRHHATLRHLRGMFEAAIYWLWHSTGGRLSVGG